MDVLNAVASKIYPDNLKLSNMPYLVPYPQEEVKLVVTKMYGSRLVATVRDPKDLDMVYNVWLPKRVANTPQKTVDDLNAEPSVYLVHTGTKRAKNPQFDSELFLWIKSPEEVSSIQVANDVYQEKRSEDQQ